MKIEITDTATAAWVEQLEHDLEYALGENRAIIVTMSDGPMKEAYWQRTDYLFKLLQQHLHALYMSLEGEGEYEEPTPPVPPGA